MSFFDELENDQTPLAVILTRKEWVNLVRAVRKDPNLQPQLGRLAWMAITAMERALSDSQESKMATGKVKWFNDQKGFGFIAPDAGGKDLFVHHSNIKMDGFRSLAEGQNVEFEAVQDTKGPKAVNVVSK